MNALHPTVIVCKDVVELTSDLLEGALDPVARARIEQHLLVCAPCTIHLHQLRTTIAIAGELAEPAPAAISPALLAAFRASRDGGT